MVRMIGATLIFSMPAATLRSCWDGLSRQKIHPSGKRFTRTSRLPNWVSEPSYFVAGAGWFSLVGGTIPLSRK
jgi:hypothetical protein